MTGGPSARKDGEQPDYCQEGWEVHCARDYTTNGAILGRTSYLRN